MDLDLWIFLGVFGCCSVQRCFNIFIYSLLTESSPPGRMIRRHLLESSKWRSAHHGSLVDVSQMRSWFEAKSSATPVANDAVYGRSPERVEVGPELRDFWSIEAMPSRKEQVQVRIFLQCHATFLWDQVMNVLCKCKVMPWNFSSLLVHCETVQMDLQFVLPGLSNELAVLGKFSAGSKEMNSSKVMKKSCMVFGKGVVITCEKLFQCN